MTTLPDDPALYFTSLARAVMIPLALLTPSEPPKSQATSVDVAASRMQQAAYGQIPKRRPISVETSDGASFRIIDGNATYGVALASRWRYLPATVRVATG